MQAVGWAFVLNPVALDTVLLVLAAAATNVHRTGDLPPSARVGVSSADIDRALRTHDEVLLAAEAAAFQRRHGEPDVWRHHVPRRRFHHARQAARCGARDHARPQHPRPPAHGPALGTLVGEAMTAPLHVVTAETPLSVLVEAMSDRGHALPVVDPNQVLVGIVTQSDLIGTAFPTTSARRTALRTVPAANDQRTAGQG